MGSKYCSAKNFHRKSHRVIARRAGLFPSPEWHVSRVQWHDCAGENRTSKGLAGYIMVCRQMERWPHAHRPHQVTRVRLVVEPPARSKRGSSSKTLATPAQTIT